MLRARSKFEPFAYTALLDVLPDPAWILVAPGRVIHCNEAGRTCLGAHAEQSNWLESVHPDERPLVQESWVSALDRQSSLHVTCRFRCLDGEYRWFRVNGNILPGQSGAARHGVAWLCGAHDVHDDKVREAALRMRLRSQTAMLNTSVDCIKVITPDGRLVDVNKSGRVALGIPEASDFGMDWLSMLPEDVRSDGREALEVARRGQIGRFPGRSELQGRAPRHWDNILTPVLDAAGRPEVILCLSRDVTVQRELEEQLRISNRELEARVDARTTELARLWNTSLDLLLVISSNGTIVRANPAWRNTLGYETERMVGGHIDDFVLPQDLALARALLDNAVASAQRPVEIRHVHRDGSIRWVEWIAALCGTEVYAIGRHVTSIKEAEEKLRVTEAALRHAQKVEAIGRLTGNVAHDFNNLLSVIRDSLIAFRMADLPHEQRARCLEVIASTTDRAIAVTRQLLDFARRSPHKPSVFCVAERVAALQDMLVMLAGSRIRVDLSVDDGRFCALADPSQFDSALVNLATNARDAMEGNGRMTITVGSASHAYASWRRRLHEGDFVAVSIADTGPGVSQEIVDRIFEPFFTTKKAGLGTGLGLSQVVGFAEQSGGAVGVKNGSGDGATFTIYLPRARGEDADRTE